VGTEFFRVDGQTDACDKADSHFLQLCTYKLQLNHLAPLHSLLVSVYSIWRWMCSLLQACSMCSDDSEDQIRQ